MADMFDYSIDTVVFDVDTTSVIVASAVRATDKGNGNIEIYSIVKESSENGN